MPIDTVTVTFDRLHWFVAEIFKAAGFSPSDAAIEADVLVWANLRGVDSHGIFRIPNYIRSIRAGDINPRPDLKIARSMGASCIVEADRAAGPVAMVFAMKEATKLARQHALGWVLVRNATHTGPIGYFARAAAAENMIGIVTSASKPLMAYHGTRVPTLSTNPLAIAVPRAEGPPLTLDMATAEIAWGKLVQARRAGTPLPNGVALDSAGQATTDPARALLPLPLAGAKGAGLSLMIECMTSLLVGAPLIEPTLSDRGAGSDQWQHGLAIAVDIAAFTEVGAFVENAEELAKAIKAQPRADGFDEVLMPGERGDRILAERRANGIPVPRDQWDALVEAAASYGLQPPTVDEIP